MFSPSHADHEGPELGAAAGASHDVPRGFARGLDWPGAEGPDRRARAEAMPWSLVHGFATLSGAGLLGAPGGRGPLDVAQIVPRFRQGLSSG